MHRRYHTVDGDKYETWWDNRYETHIPMTTIHNYDNVIQASNSIYNHEKLDEGDRERYELYEYPDMDSYAGPIFGDGLNREEGRRLLEYHNSRLGPSKQIRMWILVYKNLSIDSAKKQANYWNGGNKNELIICIGSDNDNKVTWCDLITWCEKEDMKIEIRNKVIEIGNVDLVKIVESIIPIVEPKYKRKEFKDFAYVKVNHPTWVYVWSVIITVFWFVIAMIGAIIIHRSKQLHYHKF